MLSVNIENFLNFLNFSFERKAERDNMKDQLQVTTGGIWLKTRPDNVGVWRRKIRDALEVWGYGMEKLSQLNGSVQMDFRKKNTEEKLTVECFDNGQVKMESNETEQLMDSFIPHLERKLNTKFERSPEEEERPKLETRKTNTLIEDKEKEKENDEDIEKKNVHFGKYARGTSAKVQKTSNIYDAKYERRFEDTKNVNQFPRAPPKSYDPPHYSNDIVRLAFRTAKLEMYALEHDMWKSSSDLRLLKRSAGGLKENMERYKDRTIDRYHAMANQKREKHSYFMSKSFRAQENVMALIKMMRDPYVRRFQSGRLLLEREVAPKRGIILEKDSSSSSSSSSSFIKYKFKDF